MKHIPTRICIVCRESKDKSELVRVVKKSDGTVVVDGNGREPGRGAYVCRHGDCMEKAVKKQLFNRAFKMALDKSVYETLAAAFADLGDDGK